MFATAGEDTFMHVYEVDGQTLDKLDIKLMLSSRVNDLVLTGVSFAEEGLSSVLAVPYDFSTLVVWSHVIWLLYID